MRKPTSQVVWHRDASAYIKKTAHLSMAEHGAYTMLLDNYYITGESLPGNEAILRRICRAITSDDVAVMQTVLQQFFVFREGRWHNERADSEIAKRSNISKKRSAAVSNRRDRKRSTFVPTKPPTSTRAIEDSESESPEEPSKEKEPPTGSPKRKVPAPNRGTRLPDDFQIPDDWTGWAITEARNHVIRDPPALVAFENPRFIDHWRGAAGSRGVKRDWLATYRNWIREAIGRDQRRGRPGAGNHGSSGLERRYEDAHASIDAALRRPLGVGPVGGLDDPRPPAAGDNRVPVEPGDLFGGGPIDAGRRRGVPARRGQGG